MSRLASVSCRSAMFLCATALFALSACGERSREEAVAVPGPGPFVVEFVGTIDPGAGTLTIEQVPVRGTLASLQTITIVQNGTPNDGPPNTLELVTKLPTFRNADCGRANTFCADVTLRSFFVYQELHNIFLEIMDLTPAGGHLGMAKTAVPKLGQPGYENNLNPTYGLWAYPALIDKTRADLGGAAPDTSIRTGANAASRRLVFDMADTQPYIFHARIWGQLVQSLEVNTDGSLNGVDSTTATIKANCGGISTALHTPLCGECGRTSDQRCIYEGGIPSKPGDPTFGYELNFKPQCATLGLAACDNQDSLVVNCVDVSTSDANCGICGNACPTTQHCVAGTCTPAGTCPTGSTLCQGTTAFCCPAGSSCNGDACTLSDAYDVSVGSTFACTLTSSSRVPAGTNFDGVPSSFANNALCWGKTWIDRLGSPTWTRANTVPEYRSAAGSHLVAGLRQVSAGGQRTDFLGSGLVGDLVPSYYLGPGLDFIRGWTSRANKVSAGGTHGCSTFVFFGTADPQGIFCYGPDNSPQLGMGPAPGRCEEGSCVLPSLGDPSTVPPTPPVAWPNGSMTATDVSSAGDTTCVVLAAPVPGTHTGEGQVAGTVACWGSNASGQVTGNVLDGDSFNRPRVVAGVSDAVAVSVGGTHTVALLANGSLAFWGADNYSQFGTPKTGNVTILAAPPGGTPLRRITAGRDFTCYATEDPVLGDVYCAGRNDLGQIGIGLPGPPVASFQGLLIGSVQALSAGGVPSGEPALGSACVVDALGSVLCWGDNSLNQIGDGTTVTPEFATNVEIAPFAPSGP